jgi:hypothetical protein
MKKINLSDFKKMVDAESFSIISRALKSNNVDSLQLRKTSVNIQAIVRNLPDHEVKNKFVKWASGYDFAIIDVI